MIDALLWAQTPRMDTVLGPFIQHPDVPITSEQARAAMRAAYAEGYAAADRDGGPDLETAMVRAEQLRLMIP